MATRELTANPGEVRLPEDGRVRLNVDPYAAAIAWRDMMGERRQREAQAAREREARRVLRRATKELRAALESAGQGALGVRVDRLEVQGRLPELAEALAEIQDHAAAVAGVGEALAALGLAVPPHDPESLDGVLADAEVATGATGGESTWT